MLRSVLVCLCVVVIISGLGCSGKGKNASEEQAASQPAKLELKQNETQTGTNGELAKQDQIVKEQSAPVGKDQKEGIGKQSDQKGAEIGSKRISSLQILYPFSLEVGQKGEFYGAYERQFNFNNAEMQRNYCWVEIERVLSDEEIVVKAGRMDIKTPERGIGVHYGPGSASWWFILQTNKDKTRADGQKPDLKGLWEVVGTRKVGDRTIVVAKKFSDEKLDKSYHRPSGFTNILYPKRLAVGQKGRFYGYGIAERIKPNETKSRFYWAQIDKVISDEEILLKLGNYSKLPRKLEKMWWIEKTDIDKNLYDFAPGPVESWFVVQTEKDANRKAGEYFDLRGWWEVASTKKMGERTFLVLKASKNGADKPLEVKNLETVPRIRFK